MNVPPHPVVDLLDGAAVAARKERRQLVLHDGEDRSAALAAGIGVAGAFEPVRRPDGDGDELEMGMRAVLGIAHRLPQRHPEQLRPHVGDRGCAHRPSPPQFTYMVFLRRYPSKPYLPSSPPSPDSFTPVWKPWIRSPLVRL